MTDTEPRTIAFKLPRQPKPIPRARTRVGRLPRITRLMALALRFEDLLAQGTVKNFVELARLGEVSPARITQIMNLLNLAPDIQEALLFMTKPALGRELVSERTLRAIVAEPDWGVQREMFAVLLKRA